MSLCTGSLNWAGYHACPTEKLYMSGIIANCTNIAINRQEKPYILMSLCRGSLKWAGYHTCPAEKLYMSGINANCANVAINRQQKPYIPLIIYRIVQCVIKNRIQETDAKYS